MKILVIPILLFGLLQRFPYPAYAQKDPSKETTQLKEIVVYGLKPLQFAKGTTQHVFDSLLKEYPSASIADILQKESTVYIKEYGNQMLSTISIRGTGAGHTSTLWNGLNISSPTLGQFDFSQAPVIVTDELILHHGGASSLFGNESIGGTILLQSYGQWNDKPTLLLYQDIGSFNSFNSRAVFRTSNNKVESATKAYLSSTENDFPFSNILLPGSPTEYQENARSQQHGIAQDLYWRPKSGKEISLHAWYHHSFREIQPSMTNSDAEDNQEDQNLRIQAVWKETGQKGNLDIRLGYMNDYMLYNGSIATESDQFLLQTNLGKDLADNLIANVGGSLNHIEVKTDNYEQNVSENRLDIYAWIKYQPYKIWSISATARYLGVSGFASPISPSLGSEVLLKKNKKIRIKWNTQLGLNYRIPTLNDRYWNPGGNPDLQPENSLSVESGFSFNFFNKIATHGLEITIYNMWIEDWIIWLPSGSIWTPQNLKEVESQGIELNVNGNYEPGKILLSWNAGYTYTRSTNLTQLDQYDRSKGKQLPYVPLHNFSFSLRTKYSSWHAGLSSNYTGERFTSTDNIDRLEDFFLVDLKLGKQIMGFTVNATIQNLLNKIYYHLPFRAMPGRNFRLSLSLNI
jgi:iron complex outermembrane receptor protein